MEKISPLKAVRKYCLWCCNDQFNVIELCTVKTCSLYPLRFGKKPKNTRIRVLKSIKLRCFDCSGFNKAEVKRCDFNGKNDELCDLYSFRLGRNPNLKGIVRRSHFKRRSDGQTLDLGKNNGKG